MRLKRSGILLLVLGILFPLLGKGQHADSLEYYDQLNDFQSIQRILNQNPIEDARWLYFLGRSWNLLEPEDASRKIDSLASSLVSTPTDPWIQRIYSLQVTYLRKNSRYQEAINLGKTMLRRFDDSLSLFDISHNIAISYRRINQYDSAMNFSLPLVELADHLQNVVRKHRALQNLANLYSSLEDFSSALSIEKDLVVLADQMKNHDLRILDRSNLAASFLDLDQIDSARKLLVEAAEIADETGENRRLPFVLYNLASLEYNVNSYQDAIMNLETCLELAASNQQTTIEVRGRYLLALCYLQLDRPKRVIEIVVEGLQMSQRYGLKQDQLYYLELLAEVQQNNNQYQEAIETLKMLRVLEDSIMNESRQRTIEEMKAKYEAEKKEQQITNLEKEQLINNLKLERQNLFWIAALILILAASAAGYVYYRSRNLKLAEQRLEIEQQLLRSQMNPHFLFNALSSIHSFIFQGDKYQAAEYLSLFSDLTRDVLDYSSQEWITLEKELETLQKYFQVQQMRYPDISHVIQNQLEDASNVKFPPMLLQPFVENAYEHGFKGRNEGNIKVQLSDKHNRLIIEIMDDGQGLQDEIEYKQGSKAIRITQERLAILFRRKSQTGDVSVENRKTGDGVIVTLELPLITWV